MLLYYHCVFVVIWSNFRIIYSCNLQWFYVFGMRLRIQCPAVIFLVGTVWVEVNFLIKIDSIPGYSGTVEYKWLKRNLHVLCLDDTNPVVAHCCTTQTRYMEGSHRLGNTQWLRPYFLGVFGIVKRCVEMSPCCDSRSNQGEICQNADPPKSTMEGYSFILRQKI